MPLYFESVAFHWPVDLRIGVIVSGAWKRPLLDILHESQACGGLGNHPDDVTGQFVAWCYEQKRRLFDSIEFLNLPMTALKGKVWDRWDWYDETLKELSEYQNPPYLVDLDAGQITQSGRILWPPKDRRRPPPVDGRIPEPGSAFLVGWYGIDIGHRRDEGTYTSLGPHELPPLRVKFTSDYSWLRSALAQRPMGTKEAIDKKLKALRKACKSRLPKEFVAFFQHEEIWNKIRSSTDCYFHLDTQPVEIPNGLGSLVRFMSDSQGCKHWNLYLPANGRGHAVVASYFFTGSESANKEDGRPNPKDLTRCANTFEEFMYRFWLENEIAWNEGKPEEMPAGASEYLAFYDR